ncbi:MAG: PIN domain-containing protein [Candidatus Aenigmatarchaeota archaeon]
MSDEKRIIDANILVYALDTSAPDHKRQKALELMKSGFKRQEEFCIALQSLEEFTVVVTRKIDNPLDVQVARNHVQDINAARNFQVLETSPGAVIEAMGYYKEGQDYWESLIAAVMRENDVRKILTENVSEFKDIEGVEAVNPFSG